MTKMKYQSVRDYILNMSNQNAALLRPAPMDIDPGNVAKAWQDWWDTGVWAVGAGEQGDTEWVETDLDAIGEGKGKGRS